MQSFFVDSLNAISSQLQSNAIHILTQPKRSSQKFEAFVMQLTQFKCGVLSLLQSMLKEFGTSTSSLKQKARAMLVGLEQQLMRNNDKLSRYRLHQILKRKIARYKKQSMIESVVNKEDHSLLQLQKSYIMLQKDLGIEPEQDNIMSRLEISGIINRTQQINNFSPNKEHVLKDYSIISQASSIPLDSSQFMSQTSRVDEKIKNENLSPINVQSQAAKAAEPLEKTSKIAKNPATLKKTKKAVYSKVQSAKEGLLGNLLEQTYNLCLDKQ